jgi:hypothetical protein
MSTGERRLDVQYVYDDIYKSSILLIIKLICAIKNKTLNRSDFDQYVIRKVVPPRRSETFFIYFDFLVL